jgi:hypothetical protein
MTLSRQKASSKVEPLEAQKRHTHRTAAGLEDALAVTLDLIREYENMENYAQARLRQLADILTEVRQGPHNYNPDRPAGERPVIKRRINID